MHKTYFLFLTISFLYLIYPLLDIIGIKPAPATTNPFLRKWVQFRVGAIPSEPMSSSEIRIRDTLSLAKVKNYQ